MNPFRVCDSSNDVAKDTGFDQNFCAFSPDPWDLALGAVAAGTVRSGSADEIIDEEAYIRCIAEHAEYSKDILDHRLDFKGFRDGLPAHADIARGGKHLAWCSITTGDFEGHVVIWAAEDDDRLRCKGFPSPFPRLRSAVYRVIRKYPRLRICYVRLLSLEILWKLRCLAYYLRGWQSATKRLT